MTRPHDPYEDPAVRRRHRELVTRSVNRAFAASFFLCFFLLAGIALVTSIVESLSSGRVVDGASTFLVSILLITVLSACVGVGMTIVARSLASPRIRRTGRAFGPHYCKDCGYSLAGLTEPTCPECGRSLVVRSRRDAAHPAP